MRKKRGARKSRHLKLGINARAISIGIFSDYAVRFLSHYKSLFLSLFRLYASCSSSESSSAPESSSASESSPSSSSHSCVYACSSSVACSAAAAASNA